MSQSDNCSAEISVIKQESKVNGKVDTIEGQLSFMGEGPDKSEEQAAAAATSAAKDESSFSLPTLSLFPKRFDDSQDAQDDLRSAPDLPNGHNNPDAVDIAPRTKSLDELLQESEDLPDTELIGCTKEFVESKIDSQTSASAEETEKNIEDKSDKKEESNQEVVNDKNLEEKENTGIKDKANEGSSENLANNEETKVQKSEGEEEEKINESSLPAEETKSEESPKEVEDSTSNNSNKYSNKLKSESPTDSTVAKPVDSKKDDSFKLEISDSQLLPAQDVEKEKIECKVNVKDSSTKEKQSEDNQEMKDVNKSSADNDTKETIDEINSTHKTNLSENEQEEKNDEPIEECNCKPECHTRMKLLKKCLSNACNQLDGYIKLKKHEEFTNFLKLLSEIELISENKKAEVSQDLLTDAFQEEEQSNKKRKSRASKAAKTAINTPLKEIPEKKTRIRDSKSEEPMSEINFKNLKGLAVFAKWPNSGWYYPGIIEGLTNSDWKEATNVTVKFYDGLVREMKNINILPAHLIPPTSIVCDLDDETEMVVLSTNRIENNCVEFTLSTKEETGKSKEGSGKNLEVNFNKLAIKALHMKTIKQQLEPNMDVMLKKMHMVSLDNLVSGRRSRVRTHKDDDDETEITTPRKYVRKSSAVDLDKTTDESTNPSTPVKPSPYKRGAALADKSTPKRVATPSKRMKQ